MYTSIILSATSLAMLPSIVLAGDAPSYPGYTTKWQANFDGEVGSAPSSCSWSVITGDLGFNNELQTYTSSSKNVQRSGNGTLHLVPLKDSSSNAKNGWTSGRIESKYTFTPKPNSTTVAEARIRLGTDSQEKRQGLWPAFWMLGASYRQGTPWPDCGEIDTMETKDGEMAVHATVHCKKPSADSTCEQTNITPISDYDWHTWRVQWDNRGDWDQQNMTFYLDGTQYAASIAAEIGDQETWNTVAHSPLYFILNVAVGGAWVSFPVP